MSTAEPQATISMVFQYWPLTGASLELLTMPGDDRWSPTKRARKLLPTIRIVGAPVLQ